MIRRRYYLCAYASAKAGVKAITEELCGHEFSASVVSQINKTLDASLKAFCERRLKEAYPYLILDARYERVREPGIIVSQAVLIAVAVDLEGRRQVLAVELANRESHSSWGEFLHRLKERGLRGVEFVVSDDHPGLKAAIREVLPQALWQRCYVHFLRNALDHMPRKHSDGCLQELRWIGACPRAGLRPDPWDAYGAARGRSAVLRPAPRSLTAAALDAWGNRWSGRKNGSRSNQETGPASRSGILLNLTRTTKRLP